MRIGGLASGMDIDSLVEKLMTAERVPLDKLEQQKQIYEWQRDAYRDVNKKLTTFDNYIADNFILKSLNTKTAATSNSNLVEATATGSASGSISIEGVTQLATAAREVGNTVNTASKTVATGSTKISELDNSNFTGTGEYSILLKSINASGTLAEEATEIKFKASDTIDDVVKKINASKSGVVAFFENGKLSLTAQNTGQLKDGGAEVQLVASQKTADGKTVTGTGNDLFSVLGIGKSGSAGLVDGGTNAVFRVNGIDTERSSNRFTLNGYAITLKETFNTKETLQNRINSLTELIKTTEAAKEQLDSKIGELEKDVTDKETVYNSLFSSYGDAPKVGLSSKEMALFAALTPAQLAELKRIDLKDKEAIKNLNEGFTDNQKAILENLDVEKIKLINNLDLDNTDLENKSLDIIQKYSAYEQLGDNSKVLLSSMEDGELEKLAGIDLSSKEEIDKSGLTDDQIKLLKSFSPEQLAILDNLSGESLKETRDIVNAKNGYDSKQKELESTQVQLNQATADIDKYNVDLDAANKQLAKTPVDSTSGKTVTLTATTNVDEIVDKIKEFVKTYNGFITDLKNLTNETKYRDYKPLTTLQRKELEDKEVELWERKAKSGLLRNDSIISSGLSSMRSLIYQSNPAVSNPKYNTLYNIGITTSKDYNAGGTLEIDEKKLRAALEADPDSVVQLLTGDGEQDATVTVNGETKQADTKGFLRKIRTEMDVMEKKIDERAGRGSMSETQYTLGKNLRDVNKRIETWEDKLTAKETRYWTQFSAMESMINKANNQSSMLTNQFFS